MSGVPLATTGILRELLQPQTLLPSYREYSCPAVTSRVDPTGHLVKLATQLDGLHVKHRD